MTNQPKKTHQSEETHQRRDTTGEHLPRGHATDILATDGEARFKALLACNPAGIYMTDTEGRCQYVNEAWSNMSGLSNEEAAGDG